MKPHDGQMPARLQSLFPIQGTAATGAWGERQAEDYLRRILGFAILARNWRNPQDRRDEIDLVALDREALVFVEVKTRSSRARVPGYFAIDRRKRRALCRAARVYLALLPEPPRTFRLDVVEVVHSEGPPILRHFENIGLFPNQFAP